MPQGHSYSTEQVTAMKVAYLSYEGRSPQNIMQLLSLKSESRVSKLKRIALNEGWLKPMWFCPDAALEAEIRSCGHESISGLNERVGVLAARNRGPAPNRIHVVYSGEKEDGRLERFGPVAGEIVARIINRPNITTMVAWGRTIECVVDHVQIHVLKQDGAGKTFAPISGEPLNNPDNGLSASAAAEKLEMAFGGEQKKLSLRGVAVRIPNKKDIDAAMIRAFYEASRSYSTIFGKNGLIETADIILSGVGDATSSKEDPWFLEAQELEGLEGPELEKMTIGNIGGVWFPKAGAENDVAEMNERSLGMQHRHILGCCLREASKPDPGGVVVMAVGKMKANVVARALGLVNHLIIDHTLAEELLRTPVGPLTKTAPTMKGKVSRSKKKN
jgi:DNA-binding transcriptional regulator LsrR (DeoR family)